MRLTEAMRLVDGEAVWGEELGDRELLTVYAADLMSDVLAFSHPGALLITGLTSIQSAHTADVADLTAVLFVAGKRPVDAVVELARGRGIPLYTTPYCMFDACGILYKAGLKAAHRSNAKTQP